VDNITHSLVGIALADVTFGRRTSKSERRMAVGAAVIAANLPDLDLVYTGITPAPLGYLLHHRGHTHTVIGVAVLALLLALSYRAVKPVKRLPTGTKTKLFLLIAVTAASHLLLDTLNSYGVHPFYPFDNTWYFGDAVFIFEPWLWMLLGVAAAWNARTRLARAGAALPIVILPIAMLAMGMIPIEAAVALLAVGLPFTWIAGRLSTRTRAGVAIMASLLVVSALVVTSRVAREAATRALQPEIRGRLLDVVLTPNPASPLCWSIIGIELDEAGGEYVMWRGTLSIEPRWKAPTACSSHNFGGDPAPAGTIGRGTLALRPEVRQPLEPLRQLAREDCWAGAWLQFGRAPVLTGDAVFDLRFAQRLGQNFTMMAVGRKTGRSGCPPFLTNWGRPRADLLE
jgi:inner membrane protein